MRRLIYSINFAGLGSHVKNANERLSYSRADKLQIEGSHDSADGSLSAESRGRVYLRGSSLARSVSPYHMWDQQNIISTRSLH
jgi:hypothetical protein